MIACTGFTAACGSSFTQRVLKESEAGNNTYIEVETAPLSGAIAGMFPPPFLCSYLVVDFLPNNSTF